MLPDTEASPWSAAATEADIANLMTAGREAQARGDETLALDRFTKAACAARADDPWPRLERAHTLRRMGRLGEAATGYTEVLTDHPNQLHALMGLGYTSSATGDHPAAMAHYAQAVRVAPVDDPWPRLGLSDTLVKSGQLAEALSIYDGLLDTFPQHFAVHLGLGQLARFRGDDRAALARFEAAAQYAPADNPWPAVEMAHTLRRLGRMREAEVAYDAVLALHPNQFSALLGLGQVARADGAHARALAHFSASAAAAPWTDPWPRLELASILLLLNRLEEAEVTYQSVLERHPAHFAAFSGLGHLAAARGDHASALNYLRAAAKSAPANSPDPLLELAAQHRVTGDLAAARMIAAQLLEKGLGGAEAWMSLGHTERAASRNTEAMAAFQRAHDTDPTKALPLVHMALTARDLGQPQEARRLLEEAHRIAPDNETALTELAELAWRAQDHETALKLFHGVVALRPKALQAYLGAARSLAELGERRAATALLDDAEGVCGPSPHITFLRLELMHQSGDWLRALEIAREAFAAAPQDFWLWYQRFRFEKLLSSSVVVTTCLSRAPEATHEARTRLLHFRGQAAEEDWRINDAIALYEEARLERPNDSWLLIDLARARLLALEVDEAMEVMKQQVSADAPNAKLLGRSLKVSQTHFGEILNEFMVDQESLAGITALRHVAPPDRVTRLRSMVAADPEHTPTSMVFLVALRQSGALAPLRAGEAGLHRGIPHTIMQYWDGPYPPPDVTELMEGWRTTHPRFTHTQINDEEAQSFLRQHFVPPVLQAYQRCTELAQKSDLFRLAYLFIKGGFYIDADDRCLAPLPNVMPQAATLVLYQEEYGTVGNNFIAAVPRHPVLGAALGHLVTAVNRGDRDLLWLASGPGLLTRAVARHLATSPNPLEVELRSLRILTRRELHGAVAMHCKVTYKQSKRHWSNTSFSRSTPQPPAEKPTIRLVAS